MFKFVTFALALLILVTFAACETRAEKVFGTVWLKKYVPDEPATDAEESWATVAKKAKCYVCHLKGKSKKYCNTYGDVLSEWLKSDNFEKDRVAAEEETVRTEISQALDQAEDFGDKSGTTFGELFRQYQLPNADMGPMSTEKEKAAAVEEEEDDEHEEDHEDDDHEDEDDEEDDDD